MIASFNTNPNVTQVLKIFSLLFVTLIKCRKNHRGVPNTASSFWPSSMKEFMLSLTYSTLNKNFSEFNFTC